MTEAALIGRNIREARERRDISQQNVAAALGIPRTAVTNIESGTRRVSTLELTKLGALFNLSPAAFFDGSGVSDLAIVRAVAQAHGGTTTAENVPGGARVQSVYEDRVLLLRDGHLESLTLPRQYSTGGRPSMAAAPAENPLDRMRRVLNDQPGLIADVMRPQPVFADGKQRGYRVYPGPNRQAFMRLGLRPGDLVTGINGTPLDDPTRGQEIFRTLGSSSEARVTVMRNGRQQDLTLNMTQLASEADQLSNPASPPPGTVVDPTTMTPASSLRAVLTVC